MARNKARTTKARTIEVSAALDVKAFLLRTWMTRGTVARLLWPISILFGSLAALRRFLYRYQWLKASALPVPVIVVGNLFIGGTGKTPFTIWLVEQLRCAGYHPGVIARGYGGKRGGAAPSAHTNVQSSAHPDKYKGVCHVSLRSSPSEVGDEPLLIAHRAGCPVTVGSDRVAAGRALLAAYPETDVIVTDDGLQHYRLARDIEIVLSDARGLGNGWLLPAGPLREPASRRRDFTVLNIGTGNNRAVWKQGRVEHGAVVPMRLEVTLAWQLSDHSQSWSLAEITAAVPMPLIVAAAGIGNPGRFFDSLSAVGLVFDRLSLPDHCVFTATTFSQCRADIILITEKDAVKCLEIDALVNDARLWVVPVSARIDPSFADNIMEKLRGFATTRDSGLPAL